ncbi:MAG: hypothetical protein IPM81_09850 [Saprospirales bacterium]|nr:hypothetical protein [Saprospirales bacterium]
MRGAVPGDLQQVAAEIVAGASHRRGVFRVRQYEQQPRIHVAAAVDKKQHGGLTAGADRFGSGYRHEQQGNGVPVQHRVGKIPQQFDLAHEELQGVLRRPGRAGLHRPLAGLEMAAGEGNSQRIRRRFWGE